MSWLQILYGNVVIWLEQGGSESEEKAIWGILIKNEEERLGKHLPPGSSHYRAFIGLTDRYDLTSAMQFNLLTFVGLREQHFLLDIGCGSLRAGRLFMAYLLPGRYFGVEPESWLIEEGIRYELSKDFVAAKQPTFSNDRNFTLSTFNRKFDFLLAQSIFSHASQRQIERCLSEAKKVMKPNAIFAATFVQGKENYAGDSWVYPDCVTYTSERMRELAANQGLICNAIDWPHTADQTWLLMVHPGNEKNILNVGNATQALHEASRARAAAMVSHAEDELKLYKERLARIENHPYVKFGWKAKQLLRWLKPGKS